MSANEKRDWTPLGYSIVVTAFFLVLIWATWSHLSRTTYATTMIRPWSDLTRSWVNNEMNPWIPPGFHDGGVAEKTYRLTQLFPPDELVTVDPHSVSTGSVAEIPVEGGEYPSLNEQETPEQVVPQAPQDYSWPLPWEPDAPVRTWDI